MTSKLSGLDAQYGDCKEPGQVGKYESDRAPASQFQFNETTAGKLKAIASTIDAQFNISHCLYTEFTVIWLVDDVGALLVALDEVVTEDEKRTYPLPRELGVNPQIRERKLGHPALVEGKAARIGGELNYHPGEGVWYLTNKSGRYGIGRQRTPDQLNEVAKLFQAQQFPVTPKFMGK